MPRVRVLGSRLRIWPKVRLLTLTSSGRSRSAVRRPRRSSRLEAPAALPCCAATLSPDSRGLRAVPGEVRAFTGPSITAILFRGGLTPNQISGRGEMKTIRTRAKLTGKGRGRLLAVAVAASLAFLGPFGLSISSASASTARSASVQILYPINVVRACEEQGHLGASFWNTTPYGWYCYNFSPSPPFWEWAGGVDMQGYCNRNYPGTSAIIYANNLYGWRCSEWVSF